MRKQIDVKVELDLLNFLNTIYVKFNKMNKRKLVKTMNKFDKKMIENFKKEVYKIEQNIEKSERDFKSIKAEHDTNVKHLRKEKKDIFKKMYKLYPDLKKTFLTKSDIIEFCNDYSISIDNLLFVLEDEKLSIDMLTLVDLERAFSRIESELDYLKELDHTTSID